MLSEEMNAKLAVKIDAWTAAENVPAKVSELVLDIAKSDPQAERDIYKYCEEHMLSTALVEWYNKFVDFLAKQEEEPEQETPAGFPGDIIDTARRFRDALNLFLEKYDVQ